MLDAKLIGGFVVLTVALVGLVVWESKSWADFKHRHNCKVVSKTSGSLTNTFAVTPNGNIVSGVATTPGKAGWACDDGVTYYR